jgi:regulator of RNase E activity RraA
LEPAAGRVASRHLGTAAIEAAHAGDVIVVANAGRTEMGAWGGNLALAAKSRDVAGVIVDGATRDADEIVALGFPVFARATTPVTARGRVVEEAFGEEIEIGGVHIHPGDLAFGDGTGVVFIPAAHVVDVVTEAERIVEEDGVLATRIRAGEPVSKVMGGHYERMLEGKAR